MVVVWTALPCHVKGHDCHNLIKCTRYFSLQCQKSIHDAAGMVVWQEENSGGDAQAASESPEPSHARS